MNKGHENLRPKPFTSENQPAVEKKSRKGIPNRATVFKKFLSMKVEIDDPAKIGEKLKITMYEAAALGQLAAAAEGNTAAFKELQDSLFGKVADKNEITGKDGGPVEQQIIFKRAKDADESS